MFVGWSGPGRSVPILRAGWSGRSLNFLYNESERKTLPWRALQVNNVYRATCKALAMTLPKGTTARNIRDLARIPLQSVLRSSYWNTWRNSAGNSLVIRDYVSITEATTRTYLWQCPAQRCSPLTRIGHFIRPLDFANPSCLLKNTVSAGDCGGGAS